MNNFTYLEFLEKEAENISNELKENGYIEGGINGPYSDNETPLRITAHWILIYSWLYNKTKNKKYIDDIKKMADYLYNQKIQISEKKFVFNSRSKEGKDHINGVIGQAWIIEGLVEATKILKDDKYYELAVNAFLTYPFNKKIGCWNRYEITGELLGYDDTFNHQLWYAASGAQIITYKYNEEVNKNVICFLDKCLNNKLFRVHSDGVVCHHSCISDTMKHTLGFIVRNTKEKMKKPNLKYKEEGYHYFVLYGFSLLKEKFSDHPIFMSNKMKKAVGYAINKENYIKQLKRNPAEDGTGLAQKLNAKTNIYCFPYNSPAFELPYIIKLMQPELISKDFINELWNIQKMETMDEYGNFTKNVNDSKTLIARMYEVLRAI